MENHQSLLQQANELHRRGQPQQAMALCRRILSKDEKNPDALNLVGILYSEQGNHEAAAEHFRQAAASSPDEPIFHYNLGKALAGSCRLEEAIACYRQALALDPDIAQIHINLGNALQEQQHIDESVYHYRQALRLNPRAAQVWIHLGNALYKGRQFNEAADAYRHALALDPGNADTFNGLGNVLDAQGSHDAALDCYRRALELNPGHVAACFNMANALQKGGKLDQAAAYYRRALDIKKDHAKAYANLADTLRQQGMLTKAIDNYRKALDIDPDDVEILGRLGLALHEHEQFSEAVAVYRRALAISPDNPVLLNNLGNTLQFLGRLEDAADCYQRAIDADPGQALSYSNLGFVRLSQGRKEAAIGNFRHALTLDPHLTEAHLHLAKAIRHATHDEDIQAMEGLLGEHGLCDERRMHLHFALGKSFDDLAEYDRAFQHYLRGNQLKRKTIRYRESDNIATIRKIAATFDEQLFRKHRHSGCHDDTPIFIVGMPRSGSTLTEQILASHPDVHGAGELIILYNLLWKHRATDTMQRIQFPDYAANLQDEDLYRLGAAYIEQLRQHSGSARHITDKMPHNFLFIGMIKLILPNARVIHCLRDPVDTCLSIFKQFFGGAHLYAYDLAELGSYYRQYESLMQHWHRVLPGQILDFRYEDLVTDQETQTRRLLEFCGLPWNDACLAFHELERSVWTASVSQVRRPLYRDSVRKWKHYQKHLGPLLDALGREMPDSG